MLFIPSLIVLDDEPPSSSACGTPGGDLALAPEPDPESDADLDSELDADLQATLDAAFTAPDAAVPTQRSAGSSPSG